MTYRMTFTEECPRAFPDHTQLPDSDDTFVKNFQEHPQSLLLTDSIEPVLQHLHPDGHYCIGQDSGIYWRETDPPEKGAEAPDWFYVPDVPPVLDGQPRRSYVLWREYTPPLIALEFASGDGSEERDTTPLVRTAAGTVQKPGKFWVYEKIIRIPYYGIYIISTGELEVYHWNNFTYHRLTPNDRGHYPIDRLEVELGVWQGSYLNHPEQRWLRWWDLSGQLLLTGKEQAALERYYTEQERQRAEQERQRAEQERQRAEQERQRAEQEQGKREQLSAQLKCLSLEQLQALGIDPELLE
jgi:Uma2 family endonuclease